MQRILVLGAALAALGAGLPAQARDLPAGGVTRQEVANWLTAHGRTARMHPDGAGEPIVSSAVGGVNFDIYFYSCTPAGRCRSIQYAAGWSGLEAAIPKLNGWNADKRYIRAYSKPSGAVWGEYDIDVGPGGTSEQLDATWDRWASALADFKIYIGG